MNRLKNGTFCVLPFIEEHRAVNGVRKLCCHSNKTIDDLNSVATNNLRQKILAGEPIPHCQVCYNQEQNSAISQRLRETTRWLRDPEIKEYIDHWTPDSELQTFFYDLRFSKKCNLACVSCGPHSSSLWSKELGLNDEDAVFDYNINQLLRAKKIYLAGGEPLIIDQFNDLLETVASCSDQPEIVINTNLTRVSDSIAISLKKIKNLTLTISVDAYGSVNEYHRWPMKWDKFISNLEWAQSIDCTIQFNSVVDAVTIWSIDELIALEHIPNFWSLSNLIEPLALCVNNLPTNLKLHAIKKFENIKKSRFYTTDLTFRHQVDSIIENISQPGDPESLSMYIDQIDQRRQINHINYLGTKIT